MLLVGESGLTNNGVQYPISSTTCMIHLSAFVYYTHIWIVNIQIVLLMYRRKQTKYWGSVYYTVLRSKGDLDLMRHLGSSCDRAIYHDACQHLFYLFFPFIRFYTWEFLLGLYFPKTSLVCFPFRNVLPTHPREAYPSNNPPKHACINTSRPCALH